MEIEEKKYQVKSYTDYIRGSKEVFALVLQLGNLFKNYFSKIDFPTE